MLNNKDQPQKSIESLVKNLEDYTKHINEDLKINSIFNTFDVMARQDLTTLIKMSHDRYKSVKSGNSIENAIIKQKPIFNEMAKIIITKEMNGSNEIINEQKKFKSRNSLEINNEINHYRTELKEKIKPTNLFNKVNIKAIYKQKNQKKFESKNRRKKYSNEKNLSKININNNNTLSAYNRRHSKKYSIDDIQNNKIQCK